MKKWIKVIIIIGILCLVLGKAKTENLVGKITSGAVNIIDKGANKLKESDTVKNVANDAKNYIGNAASEAANSAINSAKSAISDSLNK